VDDVVYWRVDEVLVEGGKQFSLEGPVWMFEAVKSTPIVVREPNDVVVSPGETAAATAEFTITGGAAMSYRWYRSPDPANDTRANDTALPGAVAATLQIVDAREANEGYYYCVAAGNGRSGDRVRVGVSASGVLDHGSGRHVGGRFVGQTQDSRPTRRGVDRRRCVRQRAQGDAVSAVPPQRSGRNARALCGHGTVEPRLGQLGRRGLMPPARQTATRKA
jgi:hypothetical protein